jgi:hypothetical protein
MVLTHSIAETAGHKKKVRYSKGENVRVVAEPLLCYGVVKVTLSDNFKHKNLLACREINEKTFAFYSLNTTMY